VDVIEVASDLTKERHDGRSSRDKDLLHSAGHGGASADGYHLVGGRPQTEHRTRTKHVTNYADRAVSIETCRFDGNRSGNSVGNSDNWPSSDTRENERRFQHFIIYRVHKQCSRALGQRETCEERVEARGAAMRGN